MLAMALMTTLQPLTGFHSFVMAFPMLVLALHAAGTQKHKTNARWAFAAMILTYAVSVKSLGVVGAWAEFFSVKSWGVYLGAFVLIQSFRKRHA